MLINKVFGQVSKHYYINSLEENTTTEDRIREELRLQLTTKDKTILDLQNKLQELKDGKTKNYSYRNCIG